MKTAAIGLILLAAGTAPALAQKSCRDGVEYCRDISDAVDNAPQSNLARINCKNAANREARFGNPEWGWFLYFDKYQRSQDLERDFKKDQSVILIEDDTLVPNAFGGKEKRTIVCRVSLKDGEVRALFYR